MNARDHSTFGVCLRQVLLGRSNCLTFRTLLINVSHLSENTHGNIEEISTCIDIFDDEVWVKGRSFPRACKRETRVKNRWNGGMKCIDIVFTQRVFE